MLVAALGLGGATLAGCAHGNDRRAKQVAALGGRPADPTPRGGWQNYRPDTRPYEPDPARAAATPSPSARPGVTNELR
jgi:hypothetical protein